jgi:hypothetical protein
MSLFLLPVDLDEANEFVRQYHRHHGKVVGHKFSLACASDDGVIHGVAIVGRPVARYMDDGWTLEITRLATDGYKNAASFLYGASCRAAFALGFSRIITYTLNTESGTSLKAAGWKETKRSRGGSWNCPSRPRVDKHPLQGKIRWEKEVSEKAGEGKNQQATD